MEGFDDADWKELNRATFSKDLVSRGSTGYGVKRQTRQSCMSRSYQTRKQKPRQRLANRHSIHAWRSAWKHSLQAHPEVSLVPSREHSRY